MFGVKKKTDDREIINIDLFYPTYEKKNEMKERRRVLSELPDDYWENLELPRIAQLLCPENPVTVQNIMKEFCCDREILEYRLDCLEDILTLPCLSGTIHKTVRTIFENERKNIRNMGSPDTFAALSSHIEALGVFAQCMDEFHEYYEKEGRNARSSAVKSLLGYFEDIYASDDFKMMKEDLADLKTAFSKRIKCVNVAINFNEEMRPVSAGVVGWSDIAATEKPSVFDRILYRNAKYADINVKNIHSRYIEGTNDPNEVDRKLFEELEKITGEYMGRLDRALDDYKCISFREISGIDEQLGIYDNVIKLIEATRSRGLQMCRPKYLDMSERKLEAKEIFDISFFRSASVADTKAKGDSLVVRNDISLDEKTGFWLLSGANNGGKTTFTRAVGVCQIFAQCGFYVPASECTVSPVNFIYTHFPKEEEVGINSSRFTTEVKELKAISDTIDENCMLLMNESIQSTTPKECLEIAGEFVRIFTIIGARGLFATHLTDLASDIESINSDRDNTTKVGSLVVCIDEATGERIYRIREGMPSGSGHAETIFRKFGISADEIRKRKNGKHGIE